MTPLSLSVQPVSSKTFVSLRPSGLDCPPRRAPMRLTSTTSSREKGNNRSLKLETTSLSFENSGGRDARLLSADAAAPARLRRLASEFESLAEPIDRVKRLLHYAAILPPFDGSARVEANRVRGCTTQVWLEVGMYACGRNRRMKFRADSDSEISKGFLSCLIWALDEAEPEEVVGVRAEDLASVNVLGSVAANSRVNTWHNVLMSMQERTRDLMNDGALE